MTQVDANQYLEDLREVTSSETLEAVAEATMEIYRTLGFTKAYFISPLSLDRSKGRVLTNIGFDDDWARAWQDEFVFVDPLPDIAMKLGRSFRWSKLPDTISLTKPERDYLRRLSEWDMEDGIATILHGPGYRVGFVGLGGPIAPVTFGNADLQLIQIAAETAYVQFCNIINASNVEEVRLTNREMDVLHWMAQGRSNRSISRELGIGPDTVDTYVRRLFAKLKANDRTSAVMKALSKGFVIASDLSIEKALRNYVGKEDSTPVG